MLEAVINLSVLRQNIIRIKERINAKFCFVVKADAYGHGLLRIAEATRDIVDEYAVASFYEAYELKQLRVNKPINVLSLSDELVLPQKPAFYSSMSDIIPTVYEPSLKNLPFGIFKDVNIKINSGMNRLGIKSDELDKTVKKINSIGLNIKSVYTHFYKCTDIDAAGKQFDYFIGAVNSVPLFSSPARRPQLHACASSCLFLPERFHLDMVRCGIAAYGYSDLTQPVMEIHTNILQVFDVRKGEHISYGDFTAPKDMRVAAIRIGYGDGYRRKINRERYVSIGNNLCAVVGQICMDITLVDVSNVRLSGNDTVYVLGGGVSGEMLAASCETIIYEVLTSFHSRIKRKYVY